MRQMRISLQPNKEPLELGLGCPSLPHRTQNCHGRNNGKRRPLGKRPRRPKLGVHPVRAGIQDGCEPGEPVDGPYECRRAEGVTSPLPLDLLLRGSHGWCGGRTGC